MIALINNDSFYIQEHNDVKEFLTSYANGIGLDMKVFNILANSGEMSTTELINYINSFCYPDEVINEVYETGRQIYQY